MENYYEYLKIDMSATTDEIKDAINNASVEDETYIRKIKSILFNENFKNEYDKKLAEYIINGGNQGNKNINTKKENILDQLKTLDDGRMHDNYIFIAIGLLFINFIASFTSSYQVELTINFVVTVAVIWVLFKDWVILQKNNIATFSKWWVILSPVYLYKRSNAKKESKKYFWLLLAMSVIFIGISLFFQGGKSATESSACDVVSDIYKTQFRKPYITCKNVTITESNGKNHEGIAELSNGKINDITIKELSDGQIYVTVDPN